MTTPYTEVILGFYGGTADYHIYQSDSSSGSFARTDTLANVRVRTQASREWITPELFHDLVTLGIAEYEQIWQSLAQR